MTRAGRVPEALAPLVTLLVLGGAPCAWSQSGHPRPEPPHAEPKPTARVPGAKEAEGPNLQVPADLSPAVKKQLEVAIAGWKAVYAHLGREQLKPLEAEVSKAIDALEAARRMAGRCALPSYYLGIAYQVQAMLTGEERLFRRAELRLSVATHVKPDFYEAWVELGDTYAHLDRLDEAERAYGKAIKADPEYELAYERRAGLYFKRQRWRLAQADVREAKKLAPNRPGLDAVLKKLKLVIDGPDWPKTYTCVTRHYRVRTDVSQELADFLGKKAELIHRLYMQLFPDPPYSAKKSQIIVFKDAAEYHKNGGPRGAGGHFDPLSKQLYLFQYPKRSDTLLVLNHEGFHQFLDKILKVKPPQWFNEGLADFFGPSVFVKERGVEGMKIRPNPWRLSTVKKMIRAGRVTPFKRLMTMSQAQMYGPGVGLHYAQAWGMVYFFCQAADRKYFPYLVRYFKALRRGKDRKEAFAYAFGHADMGALEEAWKEYMLGVKPAR